MKINALEKGFIDRDTVEELERIMAIDKKIDINEANYLFSLKKDFLNKKSHPSWAVFFIDRITSFLLEDEESPGEIDEKEAKWLRAKIQEQESMDWIDRQLLIDLKNKSISFPEILHFKNRYTLFFEKILFGTRFITFLAVIGSLFASFILFLKGTSNIVEGVIYFFSDFQNVEDNKLVTLFVSAVDIFLFSTVLLIFAMGIYELFINKIDIISNNKKMRPSWLFVNSIDELKTSLGKVILMILIVSFFEHLLSISYSDVIELLYLGIGILLVSAALYLTHPNHSEHKKTKKADK
ncbi:MAG: YqhA family protein [Prevotella sp.]|uniref:YqhA family protein n=1 Tax=Prevotella sp. TaxID=59823 RepID=UPI002A2B1167|nr:YqhA family protein [Prevotella sp.]MDD7319116.1 YqhA family protein [Prevotellaceae bacterium]MDY4019609.1 YqhA family protein [Prevotella sp.]